MKLNIATSPQKIISGYTNCFIENDSVDLKHIISNSCEEIIMVESVDAISYENFEEVIANIVSKLRLKGKLIISGINLDIVSRSLISEELSEKDYSSIIMNIRSMRSRNSVISIIEAMGLAIESSISKGVMYEIVAARK
jgi:glutamine amidotransferase-like uncharacterized protein